MVIYLIGDIVNVWNNLVLISIQNFSNLDRYEQALVFFANVCSIHFSFAVGSFFWPLLFSLLFFGKWFWRCCWILKHGYWLNDCIVLGFVSSPG